MVFFYQNCSDLLWEKIVLEIEKKIWNSHIFFFGIFLGTMKKTNLESTFFQIHKILKQIVYKVGLWKIPTRAVWSDLKWGKSISRCAFEYPPTMWQYFFKCRYSNSNIMKVLKRIQGIYMKCDFQNLLNPLCRSKFSWFVFCTVKENAALRSNLFMDWGHYRGHNVFKSILKKNPFFVCVSL